MTAAVQIADHRIDVVGHAVLLGDQVTGGAAGKEQPAGLAWWPGMTPSLIRPRSRRR